MAEMRGRKGPERRSGMESEGPEMRWTKYIGLGRLAGRLIRTKDRIESWIRKKTAGNHLETVGSHKPKRVVAGEMYQGTEKRC